MTADDWAAMERRMAEVTAVRDRLYLTGRTLTAALRDTTDERDAARAELAQRDQAIERVREWCDGTAAHASANRQDVPSWVESVRRALDGSAS